MGFSFRGASVCNIDAKGRFAIPTKYREKLIQLEQGECVMTIDTEDSCLLLYPASEWEVLEKQLQALPSLNRKVRRVQRLLIGHATDSELDAQGRLLIPALLREHAAIGKKLILVGQGKKFEIWSEEEWLKMRDGWLEEGRAMKDQDSEVPDELANISI